MDRIDVLVVGGGIAGIASALTAHESTHNYMIVEAANELGGLLKSRTYGDYSFDYGTHFINYTFNEDVDNVLMPRNIADDWNQFSYLKAGSYFKQLNELSPLIAANDVLPPDVYARGLVELIDTLGDNYSVANFQEQAVKTFGATFANEIIIPAIEKLFFSLTKNNDSVHI
ncbi:MAG: FAD-dependent oxidoreductase [Chitinophagaceae bacterium]|nr:MAG: FAD-dependent oxidoreductase [Chitinophagaceae bacterium]